MLPELLSLCSARRRHWGQAHPLQARFDIKTLCLRHHRLKAVMAFAAQRAAYFYGWALHAPSIGTVMYMEINNIV